MQRRSDIESLRIFSMLLIIAHHYACHGGAYYSDAAGAGRWAAVALMAGGKLGVDLFIMITGYFMIHSSFQLRRLVRVELAVLFYSVLFYVVAVCGWGIETVTFSSVKNALLPSLVNSGQQYWFIPCYFALSLLSPYINRAVGGLERKQYERLLLILIAFTSAVPSLLASTPWFDGNLSVFILMYLLGGYISKYGIVLSRKARAACLAAAVLIYGSLTALLVLSRTNAPFFERLGIASLDYLFALHSIAVVLLSVLIFLFFQQKEPSHDRVVSAVSSTTLGIYLVHDNIYVRRYVWHEILHTDRYFGQDALIVHAVVCIIIVFAVSGLIEYVRIRVFRSLGTGWRRSKGGGDHAGR